MRKKINYIILILFTWFINFNFILAAETGKEAVGCEDLISDDMQKIINEYMGWIRVLVPIAIIVLGTIDFVKAVFASKEDEMKKAQSTFMKRLIIGIIIFFIPTVVNIVIYLANKYLGKLGGGIFGNADCGIK